MAKAGLTFASPLYGSTDTDVSSLATAEFLGNPAANTGLGSLGSSSLTDMAALTAPLVKQNQFTMPAFKQPPAIAFSPSKNALYVQGQEFAADDATRALQSEQLLGGPSTGLPQGGDWIPLDEQAYGQYLNSIKNPSLGRLASKNFGIGVDNMQMLAGRGLQLMGAEETGRRIVEQQAGGPTTRGDLEKTLPFQREFSDIDGGRSAVEWFVANLSQQGPNMLESIATALAGFVAGTAAGGPMAGLGGTLAGLAGKAEFKQAVLAAAKKHAANEALSTAETKLLREASGLAGATVATYTQNLATGAADIYGELRDQGADANDFNARMTALAGAVPYAALESMPEFLLAGRVFGNIGAPKAIAAGTPMAARGAELLKRGAKGFVIGGTSEGGTELGQEALLMGLSGQDMSTPEAQKRLLESFAAGFGIGGPLGGVANLRGKDAANLLKPSASPEPSGSTALVPVGGPQAGPAGGNWEVMPPATPASPLSLPAPDQTVTAAGRPDFVVGPDGTARTAMPEDTLVNVRGNVPPTQQEGSQGVLDIFGGQPVTAGELAARTQTQVTPQLGMTPQAPEANPAQGVLQFAPAAPEPEIPANTQMRNQLLAIQEANRRKAEFESAQAQRTQQENAQREADFNRMEAQRQLAIAQQAQQPAAQPRQTGMLPMVQVTPRTPKQIDLFRGKVKLPKIDKQQAKTLRKQLKMQQQVGTPVAMTTPVDLRKSPQLSLFTQQGQPTVAALRSAGTTQPVAAPVIQQGAVQIPPTGAPVTAVTTAKARAKVEKKAAKTTAAVAKLKAKGAKDAVTQGQVEQGGGQERTDASQRLQEVGRNRNVAPQKQEGSGQAGRGNQLKQSGKKQAEVKKTPPEEPPTPPKGGKPAPKAPAKKTEAKAAPAPKAAALKKGTKAQVVVEEEAPVVKKTMAQLEAEAAAAKPKVVIEELTDVQLLDDAIATAETTTDTRTFRMAVETIVEFAYFDTDPNNKTLWPKALAFINNTQFSESQRGVMDAAFIEQIGYKDKIYATYKGGKDNGQEKPWFAYAKQRGLIAQVEKLTKVESYPKTYKVELKAEAPAKTKVELPKTDPAEDAAKKLSNLIDDLKARIRRIEKLTAKAGKAVVDTATELYKVARKDFRLANGSLLSDYFKADGTPKMVKSNGVYVFTTKEVTAAEQAQIEKDQAEERKAIAAQNAKDAELQMAEIERARMEKEGFKEEDTWDSDDGMFFRDDGGSANDKIPAGRVRILVNAFLNKLKMKPNTYVFANQADLAAKDPALYKRASAARKNGDFATTKAIGYSFGDTVIIFSDNVRTERQLKFVLAHETLGHFGLKGIIGKAELKAALERIYNADRNVKAVVDRMVEQGMDKLEAIEEYLADNAAILDVSLIARIWTALKNALNKLGFEFADDEARYLVGLAGRYVREGNQGNYVSAKALAKGIEGMWEAQYDGRFAEADGGTLGSRFFATNGLNLRFGPNGGFLGAITNMQKWANKQKDIRTAVASMLEKVQTLDNMARRSRGLEAVFKLFEERGQKARALLSKYSRMTEFTHRVKFGSFGDGISEEDKELAGQLLAHAALLRAGQLDEAKLDEFDALLSRDVNGNIDIGQLARVRQELESAGLVTAEEFRKGFNVTHSDGSTTRFQFDVDENSAIWKAYIENRAAVNEAAIDLMLSNYEASYSETQRVLNDLKKARGLKGIFDNQDAEAVRKIAELYKSMRYAKSSVANASIEIQRAADKNSEEFVKNFGRAIFNDAAFADWVNKRGIATPYLDMPQYQEMLDTLTALRDKNINTEAQSFEIQRTIRDMFLFDLQSRNADFYAKRTILSSYVPFTRRGEWQVRLAAFDKNGNPVALDESIKSSMPYFQFENESSAASTMEALETEFGSDQEFKMIDDTGAEVTVTLRAELSKTRVSPDLTEAVNFNEFVYVLNRLNANIAPDVREKIVRTLTQQNSNARKNLQRSGNAGWDKDVIRSVSEHLETTAHVAAKKLYRHRLDDIMLNNSMWLGDDQLLKDLKAAVDNAPDEGARQRAQKEYDRYSYQYKYMKAQGRGVNVNGEATLGRGENYREEAKKLIRWYNDNTNINDSTEDMLSGEAGSFLKLITVLMQLGGSIATAAVNMVSLVTHATPWLGTYNPKTAYGGGFGMAKSSAELFKAMSDLKNSNLADAKFLDTMLAEGTYEQFGLTEEEAQFLFDQTEEGTLQAAQFNALVGTARGKVFNNKAQAAIQTWMSAFSYTEQLNRRTVALAAYRMEKARSLAQGLTEQQADLKARDMARLAVNTTMGEYAMYNRPEMARGNVAQYVFMYKQFVIVSVQLLKNMDTKGQLLMLGLLLLMGGLKGLPFAEDMFDIVDTIAQKLGLKMASVEKEIAQFVDSVAPGLAPYVMRGVVDQFSGATFSSRVGMGDLIPLTGLFKAGSDPAREAEQFVGPVFSGITGLVATAGALGSYGAEVLGLKDDTTSGLEILRNSPSSALRAIGDGVSYWSDGRITNMQGKVIANNAPAHVIMARFLGFYPAIATQQNDIVRLQKQSAEYSKAIKAEYVNAYVRAKLDGDTARMNQVKGYVEEWNKDAQGTGLEITKFAMSAERAAREAKRPTALRYMKSAPKGLRPETRELLTIYGIDEDVLATFPN